MWHRVSLSDRQLQEERRRRRSDIVKGSFFTFPFISFISFFFLHYFSFFNFQLFFPSFTSLFHSCLIKIIVSNRRLSKRTVLKIYQNCAGTSPGLLTQRGDCFCRKRSQSFTCTWTCFFAKFKFNLNCAHARPPRE